MAEGLRPAVLEAPQKADRRLLPGSGGEGGTPWGGFRMAIAFGASIYVDHDGYVLWEFISHPAAEASGLPGVSRGGYVGGGGPDDGTSVDPADLLTALECLATVMLTASRTLTPTRPLFGDGHEHLAHGFDA